MSRDSFNTRNAESASSCINDRTPILECLSLGTLKWATVFGAAIPCQPFHLTADLLIALLELKHPIKQVLRCPRCGISLYVHEDRDTPIERCPRCLNGYPGYGPAVFEEITYEESRLSGLGMVLGRVTGGIKVVCGQCKGRTTRPALEKYGGVCAKCGKARTKAEKAKAK